MPPYTPPKDSELFPLWERWNKVGLAVVAVLGLIALWYYVLWPRWKPTPEEIVARRLANPVRVTRDGVLAMDPALSLDGRTLAWASEEGGTALGLWVQPDGGVPKRLTGGEGHVSEPDVSPDGSSVVFVWNLAEPGIYVIPSGGGGAPKRIAPAGRHPRYSPDGQWIAYATSDAQSASGLPARGSIWIVPAAGGTPRRLQAQFANAQSPVFHADSKHILFDGTPSGTMADWWVTTIDDAGAIATGSTERLRSVVRLWTVPEAWREDTVYFAAARGSDMDLWRLPISTTDWRAAAGPQQLTATTGRYTSVRTGGDRITYAATTSTLNLYAAAFDPAVGKLTSEPKRLLDDGQTSRLPSVSQDGRVMAYVSNRSGVSDLWIGGLDEVGVTFSSFQPITYRPALSADGSRVAFATIEEGKCRVILADVASRKRTLSLEGCSSIWDWSPDGRYLVTYQSIDSAKGEAGLLDVQTGARTTVLTHPESRIFAVRFSPDGRWLVFNAGQSVKDARLFIAPFRASGISPREWTAIPSEGPALTPAWTPAGDRLVYRGGRGAFEAIWTQRLTAAKKAEGAPSVVWMLDRASAGAFRLGTFDFAMSVTRDRLVFNLAAHSGSVWTAEIRD